jgi:excisionase family DNA binding protein
MADSREVMNIRQASQYLGVSPDTLYKYVNEQKIPAFKLGNRWRFKKSKLDQWMEEKSMETEPRARKNQGGDEGCRNSVNELEANSDQKAGTCLEWGRKR